MEEIKKKKRLKDNYVSKQYKMCACQEKAM